MADQHNTVTFTKVVGPTIGKTGARFEWSFTVRADDAGELITQIADYEKQLIAAGCVPFDAYLDQRRENRSNIPQTTATGADQSAPAPTAPSNGNGHKVGTGKLESITIDAAGKAEFKLSSLKYPLKDARGPAAVASLFDPSLNWETGHFAQAAVYIDGRDFKGLLVDWAKPDRYYNVVRIYQG